MLEALSVREHVLVYDALNRTKSTLKKTISKFADRGVDKRSYDGLVVRELQRDLDSINGIIVKVMDSSMKLPKETK